MNPRQQYAERARLPTAQLQSGGSKQRGVMADDDITPKVEISLPWQSGFTTRMAATEESVLSLLRWQQYLLPLASGDGDGLPPLMDNNTTNQQVSDASPRHRGMAARQATPFRQQQ